MPKRPGAELDFSDRQVRISLKISGSPASLSSSVIADQSLPASRALAGMLFIAMGVSFLAFQGSSALSGAYEALGLTEQTKQIEAALLGVR